MEKEYIRQKSIKITVNVVACEAESLRKVVEETSTVRVYENGCIGVAGAIGNVDFDELEKTAIENLSNGIPYPESLPEAQKDSFDSRKSIVDTDHFMAFTKDLLKKLQTAEPEFLLNNKITYEESEISYKNSKGCDLYYAGNEFVIVLTVKDKRTANLMDFALIVDTNKYDEKKVIADYITLCENFRRDVDIKDGTYKVIIEPAYFASPLFSHLSGEMYMAQASLFKNKFNEKILSDKLSIMYNRGKDRVNIPFFDIEGEVEENYKSYLIKNGIFTSVIANKKVAEDYNLIRAKSSEAIYDGIPSVGFSGFDFETSKNTIPELVGTDDAILVLMASGGDMTSSGDYATPVQCAYLVRDGKIAGKLPTLNLTGNILDFFGKDYIGASYKSYFNSEDTGYLITKMNISHIG